MTGGIPEQGEQPTGQSRVACRYCGSMNEPGFVFCSKCGKKRIDGSASAVPQTSEPFQNTSGTTMAAGTRNTFIEERISRTKTGIWILIAAVLLLWIPYVEYLGIFLAIVAGIFIIIGRQAFGDKHSMNVLIALGIYVVSIMVNFAMVAGFISSVTATVNAGGPNLAAALRNSVLSLLAGAAIVGAMGGLVYVFAFYELEGQTGRKFLWTSYAVQVITLVVIFASLSTGLSQALTQALSGSSVNAGPITAFQSKEIFYGLIQVIPYTMFAYTFNLARKRIDNGEIP